MTDSATCVCQVEDRKIPAFIIDNVMRRLFTSPRKFLSRYVSAGDTVADLGCGSGYFTLPMAEIVGTGGTVYAVDFDHRVIDRLRNKALKAGYAETIASQIASATDIDFVRSGSVDFVLAEGLLCCMKDHDGAIRQIRRVLKPGGRAYLGVIRFSGPNDPRSVSSEEWDSMLSMFRVLEHGKSLVGRWALVTTRDQNEAPALQA